MNFKKSILALIISLTFVSCSNNNTENKNTNETNQPVTENKAINNIEVDTANSSKVNISNSNLESIPTQLSEATLEEKSAIENFLNESKSLEQIPYSLSEQNSTFFTSDGGAVFFTSDGGPVFFTSDGGPVFSTKANEENITEQKWQRENQESIFDLLHPLKLEENDDVNYYVRYSQLFDSKINSNELEKNVKLVNSVGLKISENNNEFIINGITPVTIRQVNKNDQAFYIKSLEITGNDNFNLKITDENTILPWSGVPINLDEINIKVEIEKNENFSEENNSIEIIANIENQQFQFTKISDNQYLGSLNLKEFSNGKSSLIIETVDKKSLETKDNYQIYTWILPILIQ